MPVCSFCRRRFKEPRGLTVFTFDGRSIHYCSSKCRKNMEHLGRDPKKTNWVKKSSWFSQTTSDVVEKVLKEHSEEKIEKVEEKKTEKTEKKK